MVLFSLVENSYQARLSSQILAFNRGHFPGREKAWHTELEFNSKSDSS